ncbi:MAG: helix-turn-helix transcriptional regulator [Nitrospirota bacterium]
MENFEPEMITIEEFADRMKISRTTVFEWIKKDRLKAGKHYRQDRSV